MSSLNLCRVPLSPSPRHVVARERAQTRLAPIPPSRRLQLKSTPLIKWNQFFLAPHRHDIRAERLVRPRPRLDAQPPPRPSASQLLVHDQRIQRRVRRALASEHVTRLHDERAPDAAPVTASTQRERGSTTVARPVLIAAFRPLERARIAAALGPLPKDHLRRVSTRRGVAIERARELEVSQHARAAAETGARWGHHVAETAIERERGHTWTRG